MNKLDIRHATLKDSSLYLNWRNDPKVRESAFTTEKISQEMHDDWYSNKLNSDRSVLLILHDKKDPVGQVRFEVSRDYISAEINYSIAEDYRGKGIATPLMRNAIEAFFLKNSKTNTLIAKVKKENIASNKVFEKLNFNTITQPDSTMNVYELIK